MVTSKIESLGGVPMLFVNDEPVVPMAYITYYQEKNRYRDFAQAGYSLFSVQMMFARRTVNEQFGLPPFYDGIYENEEPNYAAIDRDIRRVLDACPNAYIFPRVNINLPRRWEREHPEEMCYEKYGEDYCACFASDAWAEEAKRLLRDFIGYIEKQDYRDRIVGYQISAGNTEEWIPMAPNAGDGKRAREAFAVYCDKHGIRLSEQEKQWLATEKITEELLAQTPPEYKRFLSSVTARRIIEMADTAKEMTQNRLAVGSFYGYTMECCDWQIGHHALETVLRAKSVDFLCSPISYMDMRKAGTDAYNMLPVDSLKLHDTLYFVENDTRTHLTGPACDLPRYQSPLFLGPDKDASAENLKMHFARALTHGHAMWWFDMWGGWFHDADYMAILKRCREIYRDAMEKSRVSGAEAAVFIDEKAWSECETEDWTASAITRRVLGLAGAPYDIYLMSDFEQVYQNYKALIFTVPTETEGLKRAEELADAQAIPRFRITKESAALTATEVAEFYRRAGMWVYTDRPAVVYASASHVFMHTADAGDYRFSADGETAFTDLFTGREYTFPCRMEAGRSVLFERKTTEGAK